MTNNTTDELREVIAKSLNSFGFQYAIRHCQTPKHGEGAYTEENWTAETLATFIVDDVESFIQDRIREARIEEQEECIRHYGQPQKNHPVHGDERYGSIMGYHKQRLAYLRKELDGVSDE